jgi:hypothetical protein
MDYQRLIIGYHGCDEETCQKVLEGRDTLRPSSNEWDWLGQGIYFWEYGLERAWDFANVQKKRKEKIGEPFGMPAVIGAVIQLGQCFDLFDVRFTRILQKAHQQYLESRKSLNETIPTNNIKTGKHNLDRSVFDYLFANIKHNDQPYQTLRGIFVEGRPIYEDTLICEKTHIQIAVRDPSCIVGYFRPRGQKEEL